MALADFRSSPKSVEVTVRRILLARGVANPTHKECQKWARKFIQERCPGWLPGCPLGEDAVLIGAALERAVRKAKRREAAQKAAAQ